MKEARIFRAAFDVEVEQRRRGDAEPRHGGSDKGEALMAADAAFRV